MVLSVLYLHRNPAESAPADSESQALHLSCLLSGQKAKQVHDLGADLIL